LDDLRHSTSTLTPTTRPGAAPAAAAARRPTQVQSLPVMSMLQVEQLVQRRQALFGYLKRVISGNVFFLNTVKVRPAEIEAHFEQSSDARYAFRICITIVGF
jgi:hypothetical protein